MARYIKLLPGDRASTNDVPMRQANMFEIVCKGNESDIITLDCTRWLEGATLSAATETAGFLSVVVASPLVTITVTGNDADQSGDIDLVDSTGRSRLITIRTWSPYAIVADGYPIGGW